MNPFQDECQVVKTVIIDEKETRNLLKHFRGVTVRNNLEEVVFVKR